jgi:hypothetical protein
MEETYVGILNRQIFSVRKKKKNAGSCAVHRVSVKKHAGSSGGAFSAVGSRHSLTEPSILRCVHHLRP